LLVWNKITFYLTFDPVLFVILNYTKYSKVKKAAKDREEWRATDRKGMP